MTNPDYNAILKRLDALEDICTRCGRRRIDVQCSNTPEQTAQGIIPPTYRSCPNHCQETSWKYTGPEEVPDLCKFCHTYPCKHGTTTAPHCPHCGFQFPIPNDSPDKCGNCGKAVRGECEYHGMVVPDDDGTCPHCGILVG